jgi:hypothetical protein
MQCTRRSAKIQITRRKSYGDVPMCTWRSPCGLPTRPMRLPDGNGPLVLYARDTRPGAGPRIVDRLPCLFPARDHKRYPSPVLNNRRRLAARTGHDVRWRRLDRCINHTWGRHSKANWLTLFCLIKLVASISVRAKLQFLARPQWLWSCG